ncbi:ARPP-1 family domain-containing protein [Arthrobacter sp. CP30]
MKIRQLHIGSGHHVGPLTFFPVWAEGPATAGITSGTAAQLSVAELASGPAVNRLAVTNKNTRPALLLEGELLEGGHQHRVCAVDVIIAPGETAEVRTFCVEQGRWGGATVHGKSGRRAPVNVRAELQWRPGVNDGEHQRQRRVWERVSRCSPPGRVF